MPRLKIAPSPSADVVLSRYADSGSTEFGELFASPSADFPLRHLALDPQESSVALVLENASEKAITALRWQWIFTDGSGQHSKLTSSSDSYTVDVYRPVAKPRSRLLITPSGTVPGALWRVYGGAGFTSATLKSRIPVDPVEAEVQLGCVLFEDGEMAGTAADEYAAELRARKAAAEFLAKQIRLAEAEGHDLREVLSGIVESRYPQPDTLTLWTLRYARECLTRIDHPLPGIDFGAAMLRRLENCPVLPTFYRRES